MSDLLSREQLEHQLAEATKIIQGLTELGPITQADIDWAKISLTQMDLFKLDMAAKDAEIAALKHQLSQLLFFTPGGGK